MTEIFTFPPIDQTTIAIWPDRVMAPSALCPERSQWRRWRGSLMGTIAAMTESRRLAVLNTHPGSSTLPRCAYLNQAPDLDVTALYCSNSSLRGGRDPGFGQSVTWDVDLLDGYRARFLGRRYPESERRWILVFDLSRSLGRDQTGQL